MYNYLRLNAAPPLPQCGLGSDAPYAGDTSEQDSFDISQYPNPGYNILAGTPAAPATLEQQQAARDYLATYGTPAWNAPKETAGDWIKRNQTPLLIGVAAIAALKLFGGRR